MKHQRHLITLGLAVGFALSSCGKVPFSVNPEDRYIPESAEGGSEGSFGFGFTPLDTDAGLPDFGTSPDPNNVTDPNNVVTDPNNVVTDPNNVMTMCEADAHRVGSCRNGAVCVNFDGPYYDSNSPEFGCAGDFTPLCGCTTDDATGSCRIFPGLLNETQEFYYTAIPDDELQSCLRDGELSQWESLPGTPDMTWVCIQDQFSFSGSPQATEWDICEASWICGTDARPLSVSCIVDLAAGDGSSDCTCDDGAETMFTLTTPCGLQSNEGEENVALLAAAVDENCGWEVSDAAPR